MKEEYIYEEAGRALKWWNSLTLREQINKTNEFCKTPKELHTLNSAEIREIYKSEIAQMQTKRCSICGSSSHYSFDCPEEDIIFE